MKNKIIIFLKLFTIVFSMIQGFFLTMAILWVRFLGLPAETWAIFFLYALAFIFETVIISTWFSFEEGEHG